MRSFVFISVVVLCQIGSRNGFARDFHVHKFERIQLTDVYYSEGANFGDLNKDGVMDAVYGPFWFAGPDYKTKREIYPAKPQPRDRFRDWSCETIHFRSCRCCRSHLLRLPDIRGGGLLSA